MVARADYTHSEKYEQLPMFISGKELWANIFSGKWDSVESDSIDSPEELYDLKLAESRVRLYDSIKESGVKRPIVLMTERKVTLGNGHHRSVVAAVLDLLVPVVWTGTETWATKYD